MKGQLVGPVSLGFQVTDPQKKPSFYNPSLREILVKTLAAHAHWQTERLRGTGLPALVFVDDPGLYSYGSSSSVGLGRAEIEAALADIAAAIHGAGAWPACTAAPGPTGRLLELPLDVVSRCLWLPSMQVYAESLGRLKGRRPPGGSHSESFTGRWDFCSACSPGKSKPCAGVDECRCGGNADHPRTGTLTPELAERIYRLTASLAESLQNKVAVAFL